MAAVTAAIRVAVIDNDRLLWAGLRALLAQTPDLDLVCTTATVDDHLAAGAGADVVLLDLMLGDHEPPATNVRRLRDTGHRVLIISVHGHHDHLRATIRAGASGYLIKDDDATKLADAVRAVHNGDDAFTPELAFLISRDQLIRPNLSPREQEVLYHYGTGSTLEATARTLGIKPATVREYLRRIHSKFADAGDPIANRIQLAKRAWDHVEPE